MDGNLYRKKPSNVPAADPTRSLPGVYCPSQPYAARTDSSTEEAPYPSRLHPDFLVLVLFPPKESEHPPLPSAPPPKYSLPSRPI